MATTLRRASSSKRDFEVFEGELAREIEGYSLGRVWAPLSVVPVGREAGCVVGQHWLAMGARLPHGLRPPTRAPLPVIAHALVHRVAWGLHGAPAQCVVMQTREVATAALKAGRKRGVTYLMPLRNARRL